MSALLDRRQSAGHGTESRSNIGRARQQNGVSGSGQNDGKGVERPGLVFFGFPDGAFARADGYGRVKREVRMDDGFVLVSIGIVGIVDVLSRGQQKGLKDRKAKLRCEHRPHFRHYTAGRRGARNGAVRLKNAPGSMV